MAANAPYYHQMRSQFTNATNAQFVSDDVVGYDLDTSAAAHDALYTDRQPSEMPLNTLEENHNFVELLEAATTAAAGQATLNTPTDSIGLGAAMPGKGKRKRVSSSPINESSNTQGNAASTSRSKRLRMDVDPQLNVTEGNMRGRSESSSVPPSSESLLNDARAAGVHSAAALFRRSSERSSRKYTRPPMSKLFISLQLTPENFLHLQAQAKSYMLEPGHPERQNCVGNRGKGDTDMVKLRLFNCVRDFLNEGAGNHFFGEDVEKPGEADNIEAARALGEDKVIGDKLLWPRDGNKIVSLVTPLLRRMVTNERQRMYAIESRKGGSKKKEASVEATTVHNNAHGMSETNDLGSQVESLQAPFGLSTIHSVAPHPPQHQSQHRYPTSPSLSIPVCSPDSGRTTHTSPTVMAPLYQQSNSSSIELSTNEKLLLPRQPPADVSIKYLNILIAKNKLLLKCEKRFLDNGDAPLYFMSWSELLSKVELLIREALIVYPDLQTELYRTIGMGPEALRGLAVAATEIQDNGATDYVNEDTAGRIDSVTAPTSSENVRMSSDTNASTQALAPDSPKISPSEPVPAGMHSPSSVLPPSTIPRYMIGAQCTDGWNDILNSEIWQNVKLDAATALGADQTLNVVILL